MSAAPPIAVVSDAESKIHYGRDWTRFWQPCPRAIAFPESSEQVIELVRWARREGVALVPSGGRTGLSGGAVAAAGELVVSFERMRAEIEFDPGRVARVGIGLGRAERPSLDRVRRKAADAARLEAAAARVEPG